MRWFLWIYSPNLGDWRAVGAVNDGVNDNIRQATMQGLLRKFAGGVVYASHPESGRTERFWSPDGGFSLVKLA